MYSHEQLKLMNAAAISICSQRHIQSVIEELIETALAAAPTPAEPPEAVVRDAEPWKLLLENLVEGLNKTHWCSLQGTAHFDEYLQEAISAIEREKLRAARGEKGGA